MQADVASTKLPKLVPGSAQVIEFTLVGTITRCAAFCYKFLGTVVWVYISTSALNFSALAASLPTWVLDTGSVTAGGFEDSDGILWFATANGPLRYDRRNAQYLNAHGAAFLSRVGSIAEDSLRRIWFGRSAGGVVVYDKERNTFTPYAHDPTDPNSLSSNTMNWAPHLIAVRADGSVWIGTENGLNVLDEGIGSFRHYFHDPAVAHSLAGNNIWGLHADSRDRLWIATEAGLSRLDPGTDRFVNYHHDRDDPSSLPSNHVYSVAEGRNGEIWVGTNNGLAVLDVESGTFKTFRHDPDDPASLADDHVFSVTVDDAGQVWIGRIFAVAAGIEVFDPEHESFRVILRDPSATKPDMTEMILSVFEAADGSIWLPYNTGPVYRVDVETTVWTAHLDEPGKPALHGEPVLALAEDPNGQVWIGGIGGLKLFDKERGVYRRVQPRVPALPQKIVFDEINSILPVQGNQLWISEVDSDFLLFDIQTESVLKHIKATEQAFGTWTAMYDPRDPTIIWFGSQTHGLGRVDTKDGSYTFFNSLSNPEAGIRSAFVSDITPANDGGFWISTWGQGLLKFDGHQVTEQYDYDPNNPSSIGSTNISEVEYDTVGRMWIATVEGGLNLFDKTTKQFTRMGEDSGLPTRNIFSIEIDRGGYLWLATDSGVFQFNPQSRQAIARFGKEDGLPNNTFLSWPGGTLMTSEQRLMLGALSGLGVISVAALQTIRNQPHVIFTSLARWGVDLPLPSAVERIKQIDLNWPNTAFEFEASVIGHGGQARRELRYKLDGYDHDWISAGAVHLGKYDRIPGGEYQLLVQGRIGEGQWSESAHLTVIAHPALWRELWFQATAALLVVSAVLGFASWRLRMAKRLLASAGMLRRSEERFRDFAEASSDWFWETDAALRLTYLSDRFFEVTGLSKQETIGKTYFDLTHQSSGKGAWAQLHTLLATRQPFRNQRYQPKLADDRMLIFSSSGRPVQDTEGGFAGYRGTGSDITTEIKAAEEARDAREHLVDAIENVSEGFALWDTDEKLLICNTHYRALCGSAGQFLHPGISFEQFLRYCVSQEDLPEAKGREEAWVQERLAKHRNPKGSFEIVRSGRWIQIHEQRLSDGRTILIATDIHDLKQREEQLHQAQKMESVGQLTAGIAHDFNNVLAVVVGNIELLLNEGNIGTKTKFLETVLEAAGRGARLTHRLLAFARKQTLSPRIVQPSDILNDLASMLRILLGEHIAVELVCDTGMWLIEVDQNQIENIIINIAINARDAMPDGGKLTIAATNVHADERYAEIEGIARGQYVCIACLDTGTGMDQVTLEKAIEPFFTTKGIGAGTGLGLSMAHGFVRQSNGHLKIDSELGKGTTVKIYLPRVYTSRIPEARRDDNAKTPKSTSKQILVVEDDHQLRETVCAQLTSGGHNTLDTSNGLDAIKLLESDEYIDMLLTDVVLPGGINGRELATHAQKIRPDIIVIFMSGYTENALVHHGRLDKDIRLIHKPFRTVDLLNAIAKAVN